MNIINREKGFTLIEIVLVLAIAGLIFVIVFLAVSQAQGARRDTQRNSDLGRIASALETYSSNNNGQYPSTAQVASFRTNYMSPAENWQDPSTGAHYPVVTTAGDPPLGTIQYRLGQRCSGESLTGADSRTYAVRMRLEGGGFACRDNY